MGTRSRALLAILLAAGATAANAQKIENRHVHGIIKVFLVAGLLRRQLWSYRVSLWFLAGFIAYQAYRFLFTHSLSMIALTIVDLIVAFLIWREYQARKQGFA